MPSLWSGYSSSPDIIARMHVSHGRHNVVELGYQFPEGHESSTRDNKAVSTHVYTWPQAEVACSINLYHLFRHRKSAFKCYEYTMTVIIDGVVTDRMKASAKEIANCHSIVITPIQRLTASQGGLYEIRIVERKIKPLGQDDEDWGSTSMYKLDFLCYPDPSCQLVQRPLLQGKLPINQIPAMSWKLWEREAKIEVARLQSERDCFEAERKSHREVETSQNSTRLLNRTLVPAEGERQLTDGALVLSERLQVPKMVKTEDALPVIDRIAITPPRSTTTEDVERTSSSTTALSPPRSANLSISARQSVKLEPNDDAITNETLTPPVDIQSFNLDERVVASLAPVEIDRVDREAQDSHSCLALDPNVTDDSIDSASRIDSNGAEADRAGIGEEASLEEEPLHRNEPANVEEDLMDGSTFAQENEKKRSMSTEETLYHRKRKLSESVAKRLKLEEETLELQEAEEAHALKRAEERNIVAKKRAAKRERYNSQGQSQMRGSSDSRSVPGGVSTSQSNIATWINTETVREEVAQDEIPYSPMSIQSPQIVYSGSPPHHHGSNVTVARSKPTMNVPKPLMQNHGAQGHR